MPSFEQANERVIDNAVAKFKERANKALMDGMYGLMNAALDYLHEAHDLYKPDMAHESESNTLGWALVYNGKVMEVVAGEGYKVANADITIALQRPKLAPYIGAMRSALAPILGVGEDRVSVKATTTEHLGFVGRGEGCEVWATVLVTKE